MMAERWQMQVMANKHDSERQIGFYDGQSDRLMDICDSRVAFMTENGLKHKSSLRLLADIYHIRLLGLVSFDTLMVYRLDSERLRGFCDRQTDRQL